MAILIIFGRTQNFMFTNRADSTVLLEMYAKHSPWSHFSLGCDRIQRSKKRIRRGTLPCGCVFSSHSAILSVFKPVLFQQEKQHIEYAGINEGNYCYRKIHPQQFNIFTIV